MNIERIDELAAIYKEALKENNQSLAFQILGALAEIGVVCNGARQNDDASDDEGHWATTETGNHIHINGEGVPDKGNPKIVSALKNKSRVGTGVSEERPSRYQHIRDANLSYPDTIKKYKHRTQKEIKALPMATLRSSVKKLAMWGYTHGRMAQWNTAPVAGGVLERRVEALMIGASRGSLVKDYISFQRQYEQYHKEKQ